MIGLYGDDGTRLPITYNGVTLNSPSEAGRDTIEVTRVVSTTQIEAVQDNRQDDRDGSEVYRPRKTMRLIRLPSIIRAQSPSAFYDKLAVLSTALDPVLVRRANPDVEGFIPLDFTTPRAAGDLACRYYARAAGVVEPEISRHGKTLQARTVLDFLLRDPRRYLQAESSLAGAGTATNAGNYPSYPTVTITMAGAGSSAYAITNGHGLALALNLSDLVSGDVLRIDMENRRIFLNDEEWNNVYISGDWFDLPPGANTIEITNPTNATTVTAWRSAFAL